MRFDDLGIGEKHRAFMERDLLRPEEQLGRAKHVRIGTSVERVAQDEVDELVEEDRRGLAGAVPDEVEIGRLDARRGEEPVAEGDHHRPVLARLGVGERCDRGLRDRAARRRKEARMQRPLGVAGLVRRHQLGPGEISEK
jgi:hypothetical protein